jgi:hypothetical protein
VGRLIDSQQPQEVGGLAVVLRLPDGAPDVSIAKEALAFGLAPTPLSLWYASSVSAQSGLLLGHRDGATKACRRILRPSSRDHRSLHMTLQEPLAPSYALQAARGFGTPSATAPRLPMRPGSLETARPDMGPLRFRPIPFMRDGLSDTPPDKTIMTWRVLSVMA